MTTRKRLDRHGVESMVRIPRSMPDPLTAERVPEPSGDAKGTVRWTKHEVAKWIGTRKRGGSPPATPRSQPTGGKFSSTSEPFAARRPGGLAITAGAAPPDPDCIEGVATPGGAADGAGPVRSSTAAPGVAVHHAGAAPAAGRLDSLRRGPAAQPLERQPAPARVRRHALEVECVRQDLDPVIDLVRAQRDHAVGLRWCGRLAQRVDRPRELAGQPARISPRRYGRSPARPARGPAVSCTAPA